MSRTITKRLNLEDTKFEYPHNFHYECRLTDALNEKDKITNLNVLQKTFKDYIEGQEVWDFGGAGGLGYFILKPKDTTWVVWELPPVVDYMLLGGVYMGKETVLVEQERVGPCWIIGLNDLKKLFGDKFRVMYKETETPMWEVNNTDVEVYNNFDVLAIRK